MTEKIKIPARLLPYLMDEHKRAELEQAELLLIKAKIKREQAEMTALNARLNPPWFLRRDVEFILAVGVASIVIGTWFLANLRPLLAADEELALKKAELAQTNADLQKMENDRVTKDNKRITKENETHRLALKQQNESYELQLAKAELRSESIIKEAQQQADELNALLAKEKKQSKQISAELEAKLAETMLILRQSKVDLQTIRTAQEQASDRGDALIGIPAMIVIPGGSFMMGSEDGEDDEKPVHKVTISSFEMMESEVTFALWDTCVEDKGCSHIPDDMGWGRGSRPVIRVNWSHITGQFIPWLNDKTGSVFRLPSEAEWEYAARAGSSTKYSWGDEIGHNNANCKNCGSQWDGLQTAPIKSFKPNAFGLYDMHGNVWELTQDCWHNSYIDAPEDGKAWKKDGCKSHTERGGYWDNDPDHLRSSTRLPFRDFLEGTGIGFRLVLDI